jgi:transposase
MPGKTILEIPAEQQTAMLRELRRWRYGLLLNLHILLLCAAGKTPQEIAASLLCSRSSVYRAVAAYRAGKFDRLWSAPQDAASAPSAPLSRFQRLVRSLIEQPPRLSGWCRTRWSCTALALTIKARTGVAWSRESVRRELHAAGYIWKRAKLRARDDDPERVRKLARIRLAIGQLRRDEALFWCDELGLHLLPKVGCQWMKQGTQVEVMTPGVNRKQFLAGALDQRTGELHYVIGRRKTNALFRQLLALLNERCGPDLRGPGQLHNPQGESRAGVAGPASTLCVALAADLLPGSEPD